MQKKRLMIIGAGGVGNVAVRKSARMEELYEEILLASRTKAKCDAIAKEAGPVKVRTAQVDADNIDELANLIFHTKIFPSWRPACVLVPIMSILRTMSQRTRHTLSIRTSGPTKNGFRKQV